jgi:hypothetical protein
LWIIFEHFVETLISLQSRNAAILQVGTIQPKCKLQFIGGGGEGMRASGGELLKKLDQNFQLG